MSNLTETETIIRQFLRERFRGYRDEMVTTEPLESVVDSMGLFELVSFVEQEFSLSIPEGEFAPQLFATIESIVQVVDRFGSGKTP